MQRLHLVTGGQKSGKSSYAQNLALSLDQNPMYLATSRVWDEEYKERILRHQSERDHRWINFEAEVQISSHSKVEGVVLLDCMTLWLTNIFTDTNYSLDLSLAQAKEEWQQFCQKTDKCIVISNEISMGLHAETQMGRRFVDLHGLMNQWIAKMADEVTLMVAGIPVKVKE